MSLSTSAPSVIQRRLHPDERLAEFPCGVIMVSTFTLGIEIDWS